MSEFWEEVLRKFGSRDEVVTIPGAPEILNRYIDHLQKSAIIPRLRLLKGSVALDVGTGIGRWVRALSDTFEFVVGLDISKGMANAAKSRLRGTDADIVVAAAYAMPFRSRSVDLVLSCTCLQHIQEEGKQLTSLCEIVRVAKDTMIILELMYGCRKTRLTHYPTLVRPRAQYVSTLLNLGVRTVEEFNVDPLPFVKLLEDFRNLLLHRFSIEVPSYGGTFKQRLLRYSYQTISVLALVLSLPFNRLAKYTLSNMARHVMLVARRT